MVNKHPHANPVLPAHNANIQQRKPNNTAMHHPSPPMPKHPIQAPTAVSLVAFHPNPSHNTTTAAVNQLRPATDHNMPHVDSFTIDNNLHHHQQQQLGISLGQPMNGHHNHTPHPSQPILTALSQQQYQQQQQQVTRAAAHPMPLNNSSGTTLPLNSRPHDPSHHELLLEPDQELQIAQFLHFPQSPHSEETGAPHHQAPLDDSLQNTQQKVQQKNLQHHHRQPKKPSRQMKKRHAQEITAELTNNQNQQHQQHQQQQQPEPGADGWLDPQLVLQEQALQQQTQLVPRMQKQQRQRQQQQPNQPGFTSSEIQALHHSAWMDPIQQHFSQVRDTSHPQIMPASSLSAVHPLDQALPMYSSPQAALTVGAPSSVNDPKQFANPMTLPAATLAAYGLPSSAGAAPSSQISRPIQSKYGSLSSQQQQLLFQQQALAPHIMQQLQQLQQLQSMQNSPSLGIPYSALEGSAVGTAHPSRFGLGVMSSNPAAIQMLNMGMMMTPSGVVTQSYAVPSVHPKSVETSAAIEAPSIMEQMNPTAKVPDAQMEAAYRIGCRYTPEERRVRLERYREKRKQRDFGGRVKYNCRQAIANKRPRVKGRFVKRETEALLGEVQEGQSELGEFLVEEGAAGDSLENARRGQRDGDEKKEESRSKEEAGSAHVEVVASSKGAAVGFLEEGPRMGRGGVRGTSTTSTEAGICQVGEDYEDDDDDDDDDQEEEDNEDDADDEEEDDE